MTSRHCRLYHRRGVRACCSRGHHRCRQHGTASCCPCATATKHSGECCRQGHHQNATPIFSSPPDKRQKLMHSRRPTLAPIKSRTHPMDLSTACHYSRCNGRLPGNFGSILQKRGRSLSKNDEQTANSAAKRRCNSASQAHIHGRACSELT